MNFDAQFLQDAVLNIYARSIYGRSDSPPQPGGSLDLAALREEWASDGLPPELLPAALEGLVTSGSLSQTRADGATQYALTERGLHSLGFARHDTPRSAWQYLKDVAKLSLARARHDAGREPPTDARQPPHSGQD
ncbi:hypothetical protein ED208_06605 [Stagnimonas aquatica]|uniref:PadR family transcriptional regulator n=1 Tax=Stagnimonas aquatica TaxID=2689987 RepID=A0A3N0VH03_9GAMM|nr:hypothetical protein [Stagnimonas aquatica]ROH92036.1 hypothetical protein ED208_06605 [Stagnimonas aquatica]